MLSESKQELLDKLKKGLKDYNNVVFAYVFGSYVNADRYRDVDVGLYFHPDHGLLQMGAIQAELQQRLSVTIDLVRLNEIPDSSPAMAFEIVTSGLLILNWDTSLHTAFKTRVLQRYFDTAYLREAVERSFTERLQSDKFGARNYE